MTSLVQPTTRPQPTTNQFEDRDKLASRSCGLSRKHQENQYENTRANWHGAEPGQVHRLPHLFRHLQKRLDQPPGHGIRLVQQRRDQTRHWLPQGVGKPGQMEWWLASISQWQDRAAPGSKVEVADAHLRQPEPARN